MDTRFERHEPCYDRVLFTLALDKKRMKERIMAGTELEVRSRLSGNLDADVLCDVTRPLGTFLAEFEHDPDGMWNRSGLGPLRDALHTNRWKQSALEQAACDFLRQKFETGDPLRMYAAYRVWNSYLIAREPRDRNAACERFVGKMNRLIMPFLEDSPLSFDAETGKPKLLNISDRIFGAVPPEDIRLDLWYPDDRQKSECVSAYASFYPLLSYYLERLDSWGLRFRKCKVCGKVFLAESLRYELCGAGCRKKQALQNKREFDSRARDNGYDRLYKNECQRWRNRINKAKRIDGFPSERLNEMTAAFDAFRKEALERKKAVKMRTSSPKEFMDWIYQQNSNLGIKLNFELFPHPT